MQVPYVTGNSVKFNLAEHILRDFDIELTQVTLDIPEIQSADGKIIAQDKATKAFAQLQRPLLISDDTTSIPALNGFPGPYMSYVNQCFTAEDWLRLTESLEDRRIILTQVVVYMDADTQYVCTAAIPGILLKEARGASPYPHSRITSYDGGKHSSAELHEEGTSGAAHHRNAWHELGEWLAKNNKL